MPPVAIRVAHLSKSYQIPAGPGGGGPVTVPALHDVSFEVQEGEVLGIIGGNGAGKSTLLKILARIVPPSSGEAYIHGRAGALLEVGTGFHPDLTGRENVFLNGAILGMGRRETARNFDAIVDFAGVGAFIDTPVKRYSSGMRVRLAFAVAAHIAPEVLLLDEALAVGDAAFQRKCHARLAEVIKAGRTVLLVSHSMGVLQNLCERMLLLEGGRLVADASATEVTRQYLALREAPVPELMGTAGPDLPAFLSRVRMEPAAGQAPGEYPYPDPIRIQVEYVVRKPGDAYGIAVWLRTGTDTQVLSSSDIDGRCAAERYRTAGVWRTTVEIPGAWLNAGIYTLQVRLIERGGPGLLSKIEGLRFTVLNLGTPSLSLGDAGRIGVLQPFLTWNTEPCPTPSQHP